MAAMFENDKPTELVKGYIERRLCCHIEFVLTDESGARKPPDELMASLLNEAMDNDRMTLHKDVSSAIM